MLCDPTLSEVTKIATPLSSGRAPSTVMPSVNVTVPVGAISRGCRTNRLGALNVRVTVAVKVTVCPTTEGLGAEVSVVTVLSFPTVWETPLEVEPAKFVSP